MADKDPLHDGVYVGFDQLAECAIITIVQDGVMRLPDAAKVGGLGSVLGDPERFAPFERLYTEAMLRPGQGGHIDVRLDQRKRDAKIARESFSLNAHLYSRRAAEKIAMAIEEQES